MFKQLTIITSLIYIMSPTAHALVVAPIIAVGAVKLTVWILGLLAIPTAVLTKILGKHKTTRTLIITFLILLVLGIIVFLFLNSRGFSSNFTFEKRAPTNYINADMVRDPVEPFTAGAPIRPMYSVIQFLKTIFTFSAIVFIPVLISLSLMNNSKWHKAQLVALACSISLVLGILIAVLFIA